MIKCLPILTEEILQMYNQMNTSLIFVIYTKHEPKKNVWYLFFNANLINKSRRIKCTDLSYYSILFTDKQESCQIDSLKH